MSMVLFDNSPNFGFIQAFSLYSPMLILIGIFLVILIFFNKVFKTKSEEFVRCADSLDTALFEVETL